MSISSSLTANSIWTSFTSGTLERISFFTSSSVVIHAEGQLEHMPVNLNLRIPFEKDVMVISPPCP